MRVRTAVLGGLAIGLAGLATASPAEKPAISWAKNWQEAVKEAEARNVPIFISFHKDN